MLNSAHCSFSHQLHPAAVALGTEQALNNREVSDVEQVKGKKTLNPPYRSTLRRLYKKSADLLIVFTSTY